MGDLIVTSVLWDANQHSQDFSRCYTEEWAAKLFRGFARNLTVRHQAVLFTDRRRELPASVEQVVIPDLGACGYGDCVRPFMLNRPMIFAGLDTIVVGNCDKLARYCLEADRIALPKHPHREESINGVVLSPAGQRHIFDQWRGENDMEWMRRWPHNRIDDLWPGRVLSWKGHVVGKPRPQKTAIIYFHGVPKPHQLQEEYLVRRHWV